MKWQMHPNVHAPWQEWSNEQRLHVAAAYSNPFRWRARRENASDFREHMEHSKNVVFHFGELAYGDRPFEVTGQSPTDVQLRTQHELWHKENILNLVVQRFPADWKYGAIVDADFQFSRSDWALEAIHQLQHHEWVQLYSSLTYLSSDHRPYQMVPTFAWQYRKGTPPQLCHPYGKPGHGEKIWAPGGAWAFRRSAFDTVGGLLDICVLGSADWYMACGLMGEISAHPEEAASPGFRMAITRWQERAHRLQRNIGFVENHAIHAWHGPTADRKYPGRYKVLLDNHYDPFTDISRDWQGVWQLTGSKPRLRDDIRAYFRARNENDPNLGSGDRLLV